MSKGPPISLTLQQQNALEILRDFDALTARSIGAMMEVSMEHALVLLRILHTLGAVDRVQSPGTWKPWLWVALNVETWARSTGNTARDAMIRTAWRDGRHVRDIAATFKLSWSRIYQVCCEVNRS